MGRRISFVVIAILAALTFWGLRSADEIHYHHPKNAAPAGMSESSPSPLPTTPFSNSSASPSEPSSSSTPTPSAEQLLNRSLAAIRDATTVHVQGRLTLATSFGITVDLSMTQTNQAVGTFLVGIDQYDVIRINNDCYVKGRNVSLATYRKTCTIPTPFEQDINVLEFTDFAAIHDLLSSENIGPVTNDGETTEIIGPNLVRLKGTKATIAVAPTGTPFPARYVGPIPAGIEGSLDLTDWNKPVKVARPK